MCKRDCRAVYRVFFFHSCSSYRVFNDRCYIFSLISALNPCNTALHSIGTFLFVFRTFAVSVLCFRSIFLHGTYYRFQVGKFFFNFGVDMFLQSFNLFVCLQVTFMQSFIDSFDEFFEFSISCVIVVGYFGERLCYLVIIDSLTSFTSSCTVVVDRSKSDTSSVRSFKSCIMFFIQFLSLTASASDAGSGFSSSSPLTSMYG